MDRLSSHISADVVLVDRIEKRSSAREGGVVNAFTRMARSPGSPVGPFLVEALDRGKDPGVNLIDVALTVHTYQHLPIRVELDQRQGPFLIDLQTFTYDRF